jgi:hypothetical protein
LSLYNDAKIATILIKKGELPCKQRDNIHNLYEDMVKNLLIQLFKNSIIHPTDTITFIASRRETSKYLNNLFISSIGDVSKTYKFDMKVKIQAPDSEK